MAKKKRYERTEEYQALKRDLLDDLQARGLVQKIYQDWVEEYMSLWIQRQEFRDDIQERGVVVLDEKRAQMVENRSASLRLQTDKQMQSIFADLGFRDIALKGGGSGAMDDEL